MKPGDKVWKVGDSAWFLDRYSMTIRSAVVTDVFIYGNKKKYCLLSLDDEIQERIASGSAFPTREELCKHYRKIFE